MPRRTRALALILFLLLVLVPCSGQTAQKGLYRGIEGGMMLHTGYLSATIAPADYKAKGVPVGVGGLVRVCLGDFFRLGAEGYMSHLPQMRNGSFVKYGWGGVLCDFCMPMGERIFPFAGLTIGGGSSKDFLMFGPDEYYYNSQLFFALDPFVGCEFQIVSRIRLAVKLDFLNCIGDGAKNIPMGPRLYFGFIFCH